MFDNHACHSYLTNTDSFIGNAYLEKTSMAMRKETKPKQNLPATTTDQQVLHW